MFGVLRSPFLHCGSRSEKVRTLALESSGRICRIAALSGPTPLCELELDSTRRSAQTLAPGIQTILSRVGWTAQQLELIVVTQGPGSFTGLRIGVTTAKTLAYVTGAEVMGVNTLDAIAEQAGQMPVWAVLDAQRQQLFAALFTAGTGGAPTPFFPTQIIDLDVWLGRLTPDAAVSGSGLAKILQRLPKEVAVVHEDLWNLRATTVGQLGLRQYQGGRRDDVWHMVPEYFRQSAAEEKRAK